MEIVIKISKNVYKALAHTEFDANLVVNEMRKSIANGIPLPKGRGRLIYTFNYCPNCGAKMISTSKDVK